jgi:hypothetical protein
MYGAVKKHVGILAELPASTPEQVLLDE